MGGGRRVRRSFNRGCWHPGGFRRGRWCEFLRKLLLRHPPFPPGSLLQGLVRILNPLWRSALNSVQETTWTGIVTIPCLSALLGDGRRCTPTAAPARTDGLRAVFRRRGTRTGLPVRELACLLGSLPPLRRLQRFIQRYDCVGGWLAARLEDLDIWQFPKEYKKLGLILCRFCW